MSNNSDNASSSGKIDKKMSDLLSVIEKQNESLRSLLFDLATAKSSESSNGRSKSAPTAEEIKPQVLLVLHNEAERNKASTADKALLRLGDETLSLEDDLNIGKERRRMLAKDYSNISTNYSGGESVGIIESGNLKTVGKVIKLVTKRANGK